MLSNVISGTGSGNTILGWIDVASIGIELLAVMIIVGAILYSTLRYIYQELFRLGSADRRYGQYKLSLGKSLLLGLEILVAADVVRTVALDATLQSVIVLGLLVLIRTFLSWSLVVELEGHWPWQVQREREALQSTDRL